MLLTWRSKALSETLSTGGVTYVVLITRFTHRVKLMLTILTLQAYEFQKHMVRDDPKLQDDGGETRKSQGRGWPFDSRL